MAPKKDKEVDPGWQHGEPVGNDRHKVKCKYCWRILSGGVYRFKKHLAHMSGDAKGCPNVPTEVRQHMRALMEGKQVDKEKKKYHERLTRMGPELVDVDDDDDEEIREIKRGLRASWQSFAEEMARREETKGGVGSSSAAGRRPSTSSSVGGGLGTIDTFLYTTQSTKQTKLGSVGDMKAKVASVGRACAKAFYYNGWPPHIANSPYFKSMCEKIAEAGLGVEPPTAYEISNKYLEMEVEDFKKYIETFKRTWVESGCTIMCDGWMGTMKEQIINFMVYCTRGTIFMKSFNASGKYKDAIFISSLMEEIVGKVGAENVVQIITDNEASYRAAARIVQQAHPHIFATPCAAHCIDLMLEDIYQIEEVGQTIDEGKKITGLIYNHEMLVSLLKHFTSNGNLLRPRIMRFATNFISLESLCRHKAQLLQMFTSDEFIKSNLYKDEQYRLPREVLKLVCGESFWDRAEKIVFVLEPLVLVLKLVDGNDKATMGYLYEAMDRAKLLIQARCRDRKWKSYYKPFWKIIDNRWNNQLHQDIHAAGYYLNPMYQYSESFSGHPEIFVGFKKVVERMSTSVNEEVAILREVKTYRDAMGAFGGAAAIHATKKMEPADWWKLFGEDAPHLQRIAIRILSQTTTSSGCEQNWSTFSLIHTKQRNCLSYVKLEKLVFVHYNMRLRARNLKRQDVRGAYNPINLDYIFKQDDPLSDWLVEKEPPCFPLSEIQSMDRDTSSEYDDVEIVPLSVPQIEPELEHEQPQFHDEGDALRWAKGKQAAGSSSQEPQRQSRISGFERTQSQVKCETGDASQLLRLKQLSAQVPQRRRVENETTQSQPRPKTESTSIVGMTADLISYRRLRKRPKPIQKHVSPTPQPTQPQTSSSTSSKTASGSGNGNGDSPSGVQ